jgi:hypothetical protein
MFQRSHHVSIALRPRCSFLRTQLSLWSVAYIQVSPAERPKQTPGVGAYHLFIYIYILNTVDGQGGTLWHHCLYVPWREPLASYCPAHNIPALTTQKTPVSIVSVLLRAYSFPRERVYRAVAQKRSFYIRLLQSKSCTCYNLYRV